MATATAKPKTKQQAADPLEAMRKQREQDIQAYRRMIADGGTDPMLADVARSLGLTPNQVKAHLEAARELTRLEASIAKRQEGALALSTELDESLSDLKKAREVLQAAERRVNLAHNAINVAALSDGTERNRIAAIRRDNPQLFGAFDAESSERKPEIREPRIQVSRIPGDAEWQAGGGSWMKAAGRNPLA